MSRLKDLAEGNSSPLDTWFSLLFFIVFCVMEKMVSPQANRLRLRVWHTRQSSSPSCSTVQGSAAPSAPLPGMLCTALFLALGQKTLQNSNQAERKTAGDGMYHFRNSAAPSCPPAVPVAGSREPTRGPRTSLPLSRSVGARRCVAVRRALGNRCAPPGPPQRGVRLPPSSPPAGRCRALQGRCDVPGKPHRRCLPRPRRSAAPRHSVRVTQLLDAAGAPPASSKPVGVYCLPGRGYFSIFFYPPPPLPTNCSAFRIILKLIALLKD